jgi:hypothetical protein
MESRILDGEDGGVESAVLEAEVQKIEVNTPEERIEAFRKIIRDRQCHIVDGTLIDLFSASVVCQVYDALSKPENQKRFASMQAGQMGITAYKLVEKVRG